MNCAYVTLVGTNNYVWGAIGCALSAKMVKTKYPFIFMVNDTITQDNIDLINSTNLGIVKMIPNDLFPMLCANDTKYCCTKQKLQVFNLNYDKIIFLDADVILTKSMDIFFDYLDNAFSNRLDHEPEPWLAKGITSHCCGECFLISPNKEIYKEIINNATLNNLITDEDALTPWAEKVYIPSKTLFNCIIHWCEPDENQKKYWENQNIQSLEELETSIRNEVKRRYGYDIY